MRIDRVALRSGLIGVMTFVGICLTGSAIAQVAPAPKTTQAAKEPATTVPGKAVPGKAKVPQKSGTPFSGFGSNSREPIKIDSNRLEVFDKENRAVYSGDVVLVQGQTTLRSTVMTVFYISNKGEGANPGAARSSGQNSIRKIDFNGPISILSGTQSATSKFMTYDAQAETVTLTGNVVIADCDNVQRGERAVYDIKTGRATVDSGAKGRVQGIFTPGSDDKKKTGTECGGKADGKSN